MTAGVTSPCCHQRTSVAWLTPIAFAATPVGTRSPGLVYFARRGHRVLRRTILREVPPGRRCPACIGWAGR